MAHVPPHARHHGQVAEAAIEDGSDGQGHEDADGQDPEAGVLDSIGHGAQAEGQRQHGAGARDGEHGQGGAAVARHQAGQHAQQRQHRVRQVRLVGWRHQYPGQAVGDDAQQLRDHADAVQLREIRVLLFAVAAKCEGNGNAPQGRKVRNAHDGYRHQKERSAR